MYSPDQLSLYDPSTVRLTMDEEFYKIRVNVYTWTKYTYEHFYLRLNLAIYNSSTTKTLDQAYILSNLVEVNI